MNDKQSGIVCVGMVCVDVLAKTVDDMPDEGKLVLTDSITLQVGGCAANAAICLARLGVLPSIIGKIGRDNLGRILSEKFSEEGIEIDGLITGEHECTSSSLVLINSHGERSVVHTFGANRDFRFEDIDTRFISGQKILLIAGTFLMPAFDGAGTEKMLLLARENKVLCCMDTAWDSTGRWLETIDSTLQYLDWFMPSYDEAHALSGMNEPQEMANFFQQKGVRNVIVKMAEKGCFIKEGQGDGYIVPAYTRVTAVDASGAGDAFCAGFIAGLNASWEVKKCARFANAVSAHCIMRVGTTSGVKSMAEILQFMNEYELANP